jgi:hypothetical protein
MASRFRGINKEIATIYQGVVQELTKLIPGEGELEDPQTDDGWMVEVTKKMVELFFSMFGTTDSSNSEAFSQKLTSAFKSKKAGPKIKEQFLSAAQSFYKGTFGESGNPFEDVFQTLMEGLLITWIETYDKPVITTSFMEMVSYSRLGYYAYSTPERAALVLTKLIEYGEYLERKDMVRGEEKKNG